MLKGKTALVTGSTSGIGLGIAKALAKQGANIVLNGFGDVEGPKEEIAALGAAMAQALWRDDVRGTAEYRLAMTPVLLARAMASLLASQEVSDAG